MQKIESEIIINNLKAELIKIRGNRRVFCDKTGIGYDWVSKFANGHISDPGIRTIERLQNALDRWGQL